MEGDDVLSNAQTGCSDQCAVCLDFWCAGVLDSRGGVGTKSNVNHLWKEDDSPTTICATAQRNRIAYNIIFALRLEWLVGTSVVGSLRS